MSGGDPPIIIKGSSVTIEFNPGDFQSTGHGKHSNANKKIRRVEVTGDGINFAENIPNGKVTVTIYYGNSSQNP